MKRNLFLIAVLVVAAVALSACKKSNISMKPETTKVSGDLAECFEVVDEGVDVKLKDGKLELFESVWRVKVRRTDAPLPFEEGVLLEEYGSYRTDGQAYYLVGFGLRIEGADGDVVQENKATEGGLGGPYSHDDVGGLLKLKPGEVGEIRWSVDDKCLDAEEPLKFKISSAYELVGNPEESKAQAKASSIELSDVSLPSQLKDKVEVIRVSKKVKSTGYPEVTVTFKLLSTVNTKPLCGSTNQMWLIGIGQDEDGADVEELLPGYREWRSQDRDGRQFKEFLESEPGETITLSFTGNDSGSTRSDLERVAKFKLKITK